MISENTKYAYFLGIGGIGMSAIARYFYANGMKVFGYDKTATALTEELENEGITIHFIDSEDALPADCLNNLEETIFIYTPAIPKDNKIYVKLVSLGVELYKRSEVLGFISMNSYCIAVAGTHGKTTTSTLIAHLLYAANVNFTAFLGGISANYNSNYLHYTQGRNLFADKPIVVLEADEFDRSFHRLSPDIAIITAIDPDHLDIYKTKESFYEAFQVFASKIKPEGYLIANAKLELSPPDNVNTLSYSANENTNANCFGIFSSISKGNFNFDYLSIADKGGVTEKINLIHLYSGLPGFHNIENATAATVVGINILQLDADLIRDGLASFSGVKRRFEFIVKSENYVVIDDYAHHPEELNAIIHSVKKLYPNKKLTAIFQPHLYSRTQDFANEFALSLSFPDEIILMDIYPARELPIPGITSQWLLEKINSTNKYLCSVEELTKKIHVDRPELLLILGAGDIDKLVPVIKEMYADF